MARMNARMWSARACGLVVATCAGRVLRAGA
ncbi:MAG: hypothetical protein RIS86_869, partial [Planctomycetota bacterium]